MNIEFLYGIYELVKIEAFTDDGSLTSERAKSGVFVFMRDHKLSVVSGSNEWVMSYTGTFKIEANELIIFTESCSAREREGTQMKRKILKMDGTWLILETTSIDKGTRTELTWKKKIQL